MSVLGGGGSQSARREAPACRRLPTTFSLMDNHIGENLISYGGSSPLRANGVWTEVDPKGHDSLLEARRLDLKSNLSAGITSRMCYPLHCRSL